MNEYIEEDWNRATTADLRIAELAEVAYDLVRTGGQATHTAAAVYGDMKPYLARLVGWERGLPAPGRRVLVPELPDRMLPVISQPYRGRPEDEEFLKGARAFDVCHDVIFTNLCDIYDQRWA
ncbi:MAG: hypothetical protein ABW022_08440 [Actinoplanes sp.]